MNLSSMLEGTARKFPRKEAVVYEDRRLSYGELVEASRRAAAVFRDAGVKRGDVVAVMTYNTPGFIIAAFGLWRAGATLVPVNHKLAAPEVRYLIEHSGAVLGVVDAAILQTATTGAPGLRWLVTEGGEEPRDDFDLLVAGSEPWDGVEIDDNDIAQILYTSGTTSSPKGCRHSHRGLSTVPAYTTAAVGLRGDDRFLLAMPIWHSSPLNNWFLSMIFLGGTVILQREYHPIEFLRVIGRERVTAFFGAPIAYLAPLQVARAQGIDLASFDLSTVRLWLAGGAPIGADTARALRSAYPGGEFHQVYGMTEMGPVGTALGPSDQERKAGSIGAAGMPGVDVRVVAESGDDALAGESGEIWMRSDTRMVGYLNDDAATEAAFSGEWYRTGDVARVDEDGYLYIVDRLKDVIITGGENVYSLEVEAALLPHPDVQDVAVIGRPHPEWGETIVAVVVLVADAEPSLDELRAYLGDRIARYKIPRELQLRDSLPRNPSGKVLKHLLRAELEVIQA